MGDIDLWCLSPNEERLIVNPRWLLHLQGRLLGDDGHPRKAKVSPLGISLGRSPGAAGPG